MGKINSQQLSWTKGEVSPLARGRADVNLYTTGAQKIENLIVRPQGPLFRRSGTKFVASTKNPTESAITVPFEVSDEQAYKLEFGRGYIHFYKSREPIFESTNDEVEAFTLSNNGGLMQLTAEDYKTAPVLAGDDYGDLPTFDITCIAPVNTTIDEFQITTSVPHTYKTGSKVIIYGAGLAPLGGAYSAMANNGGLFQITVAAGHQLITGDVVATSGSTRYPASNGIWTVTVSGNNLTLQGSTYADVGAGTLGNWGKQVTVTSATTRNFKIQVTTASVGGTTGFAAGHGLIAGDKFYISGATDYPQLSERYHLVKSVEAAHKWTIANIDFDNFMGAPTGEEAQTIPVEIETEYGYGQKFTITSSTFHGPTSSFLITTNVPHGYTHGDTVIVLGAGIGVDGKWTVSLVDSVSFVLDNSVFVGAGTTGGTVKRELTSSEFSIKDLQVAQSADVLYITHPLYPTTKLVRLDNDGDKNDWLLAEIEFSDGPYLNFNDLAPNVNATAPQNGSVYRDVFMELSSYTHTATVTSAVAFGLAVTGVANAAGLFRITVVGHGYSNGDSVSIINVITGANGNWTVSGVTANTFDLAGSTYGAGWVSGGTVLRRDYFEFKLGDQWRLAKIKTLLTTTTATVDIIDNLMLSLDETTLLKKTKNSAAYIPGSNTASSAIATRSTIEQNIARSRAYYDAAHPGQKIDPNNELSSDKAAATIVTTAGTITSQYSNTFAASDIGKYVRIKPSEKTADVGYWVQILTVATGTANKATHTASLKMVANNATGKFVISSDSKTATVTAKQNLTVYAAFVPTDVGRLIRFGYAGRWCWGVLTGYTSTSVMTVTLYADVPRDPNNAAVLAGNQDITTPTTGITYDWRMGSWSYTTGYPAHVVFHEQRLTFAATPTEPQTFWMSVSGDFENFLPTELDSTTLDDNSVVMELSSAKANPIRWLVSGPSLMIGTAGGEWQVKSSGTTTDPITPSSKSAKEHTTHGSGARVKPAKVGASVLFTDRTRQKVHELFYSYENDAVVSSELTIISEHIVREHDGAVCSVFQEKPHSIYWIVCADGTLSAVTFNKEQEVVAWHHHTIAGGLVEWITTIPADDGSEDELWMVVARTVNGATYRTIEVMESDYYPPSQTSRAGMKFQDGHITIPSGTPYFTGTTISGLNWLSGESVTVLSDNARLAGAYTVSSTGTITLASNTYDQILIGVNGNADLESLPPEGGSQYGTSQGQIKRIINLDVRLLNCISISHGPSASILDAITLPNTSPAVWFTGTHRLTPKHGYDVESKYYIRQADPYPLNILFVVAKMETNE